MSAPKWPMPWQRGSVQVFNHRRQSFREDPNEAVIYCGGDIGAEEDDEVTIRIEGPAAHAVADLIEAAPDLAEAAALLEAAEDAHVNCEECEGEGVPELCPVCFPLFDDARLKRRAALAKARGEK